MSINSTNGQSVSDETYTAAELQNLPPIPDKQASPTKAEKVAYSLFVQKAHELNHRSPPTTPEKLKIARSHLKNGASNIGDIELKESPKSIRALSDHIIGRGANATAKRSLNFNKLTQKVTETCTKTGITPFTIEEKLKNHIKRALREKPELYHQICRTVLLDFKNREDDMEQEAKLMDCDFNKLPLDAKAPQETVLFAYCDIAEGLFYLHFLQLLHQDIKPANFLYSKEEKQGRITDFGSVKHLSQSNSSTFATPVYSDPEVFSSFMDQVERKGIQDTSTDVYMLARSLEETIGTLLIPKLSENKIHYKTFAVKKLKQEELENYPNYDSNDTFFYMWHSAQEDKDGNLIHTVYKLANVKRRGRVLLEKAEQTGDRLTIEMVKLVFKVLNTPPPHKQHDSEQQRLSAKQFLKELIKLGQTYCPESFSKKYYPHTNNESQSSEAPEEGHTTESELKNTEHLNQPKIPACKEENLCPTQPLEPKKRKSSISAEDLLSQNKRARKQDEIRKGKKEDEPT